MLPQETIEFNRAMKWRFSHGTFEYNKQENGQDIKYTDRGRDHEHLTVGFRNAALSSCNLSHHKTLMIPIFFHNFGGYYTHHIATHREHIDDNHICVIVQGREKYLTL